MGSVTIILNKDTPVTHSYCDLNGEKLKEINGTKGEVEVGCSYDECLPISYAVPPNVTCEPKPAGAICNPRGLGALCSGTLVLKVIRGHRDNPQLLKKFLSELYNAANVMGLNCSAKGAGADDPPRFASIQCNCVVNITIHCFTATDDDTDTHGYPGLSSITPVGATPPNVKTFCHGENTLTNGTGQEMQITRGRCPNGYTGSAIGGGYTLCCQQPKNIKGGCAPTRSVWQLHPKGALPGYAVCPGSNLSWQYLTGIAPPANACEVKAYASKEVTLSKGYYNDRQSNPFAGLDYTAAIEAAVAAAGNEGCAKSIARFMEKAALFINSCSQKKCPSKVFIEILSGSCTCSPLFAAAPQEGNGNGQLGKGAKGNGPFIQTEIHPGVNPKISRQPDPNTTISID